MKEADRTRLQRLLASLNEPALVALANKGLVRRAAKDLEAGNLSYQEEEDVLIVHGPGWTVRMPPTGPADAEDDTRASGVTRQVLAATLYLQNIWVNTEDSPTEPTEPEGETLRKQLAAISPEHLQRWAGKRVVQTALTYLQNEEVIVTSDVGVAIRFESHEVEVRLLGAAKSLRPSALLDRVISTAPKAVHREWIAASVLALWREDGQNIKDRLQAANAESRSMVPGRNEVLARALNAMEALVATGVAHPSSGAVEQFFTLSVSSRANDLPRLSRLLRSIADQLALIQSRDVKGSTDLLLNLVALAHAMAEATQSAGLAAPTTLTGRHRTEYDGRGNLTLTGLGAYPWKTASGYEGLTLLFWDAAARSFRTWSDSRPVGSADRFSPTAAYTNGLVWETAAPLELCRSSFEVKGAKWNDVGRLSSISQAVEDRKATVLGDVDLSPVSFDTWTRLAEYARSTYPLGLRDSNPLARIVVLSPTQWGERVFDETQQRFMWDLLDAEQAVVRLSVPWTELNVSMVEFLEAVKPEREKLSAVIARISFSSDGASFEPLSLLGSGEHAVLNPAFDAARICSKQSALLRRLREKFNRRDVTAVLDSEADEFDQLTSLAGVPTSLSRLMADSGNALLTLGESGVRANNKFAISRLVSDAASLDRIGLSELAAALRTCTNEEMSSRNFLYAQYLQNLYAQAARMSLTFGV